MLYLSLQLGVDLGEHQAGDEVTCDPASLFFFFRGGKERLIQLLDYSSVASPESGLFSDWSRNKGFLELSRD